MRYVVEIHEKGSAMYERLLSRDWEPVGFSMLAMPIPARGGGLAVPAVGGGGPMGLGIKFFVMLRQAASLVTEDEYDIEVDK